MVRRDTILLHAAFQVLTDFIGQERPGEIIDWNSDEMHRHAWDEMPQLYRWRQLHRLIEVRPFLWT